MSRETREAPSAYVSTHDLEVEFGIPASTFRYWRHIGAGPKSFKLGRRVLYARTDVEAWVAKARAEAATA